MRGADQQPDALFSYVSPEQRVRPDHPLRAMRRMTDEVFAALSPRFTKMYSEIGRPSIPPEQLLRALLLQYLYTIRSERLLMEEIDYSVLFRWFVGLGMDEFCKSRRGDARLGRVELGPGKREPHRGDGRGEMSRPGGLDSLHGIPLATGGQPGDS